MQNDIRLRFDGDVDTGASHIRLVSVDRLFPRRSRRLRDQINRWQTVALEIFVI